MHEIYPIIRELIPCTLNSIIESNYMLPIFSIAQLKLYNEYIL